MSIEEPGDEDVRRPDEEPPEEERQPEDEREEPARQRRAVRVCDRDWGFLALASPWALTRGVGHG
jgi:hypothetical protein